MKPMRVLVQGQEAENLFKFLKKDREFQYRLCFPFEGMKSACFYALATIGGVELKLHFVVEANSPCIDRIMYED